LDTFAEGVDPQRIVLWTSDSDSVEVAGDTIGAPYAEMIRDGDVDRLEVYF
jgi:hypothetical protein